MGSEIALALLATVLLVVVAMGSANGARDITNLPLHVQLWLGLVCGAIGAVLATVPFTDVVPDRWETQAGIASVVAAVVVIIHTTIRRRRRRRRVSTG